MVGEYDPVHVGGGRPRRSATARSGPFHGRSAATRASCPVTMSRRPAAADTGAGRSPAALAVVIDVENATASSISFTEHRNRVTYPSAIAGSREDKQKSRIAATPGASDALPKPSAANRMRTCLTLRIARCVGQDAFLQPGFAARPTARRPPPRRRSEVGGRAHRQV